VRSGNGSREPDRTGVDMMRGLAGGHTVEMASTTEIRRVLIVDDQRSFAQSLEVVIDSQDDLRCVGIAATGLDAVDLVRREQPAVVLMDVGLPGIDGIEATKQVVQEYPEIVVIILTGIPDATVLARAAAAGAQAFLLKDSSVEEILGAIRASHRHGQIDVGSDALRRFVDDEGTASIEELTQRELEVLGLLAEGRQPKEIARALGISLHTCRGYVKNVLAKLGAHSALEAVVLAHRRGLIALGAE
jgi:DNA-binding NarL/FixJ family response regulator